MMIPITLLTHLGNIIKLFPDFASSKAANTPWFASCCIWEIMNRTLKQRKNKWQSKQVTKKFAEKWLQSDRENHFHNHHKKRYHQTHNFKNFSRKRRLINKKSIKNYLDNDFPDENGNILEENDDCDYNYYGDSSSVHNFIESHSEDGFQSDSNSDMDEDDMRFQQLYHKMLAEKHKAKVHVEFLCRDNRKIINTISSMSKIVSYPHKKFLPSWKLTIKKHKLMQLRLQLVVLIPRFINESNINDVADINCEILGTKYTNKHVGCTTLIFKSTYTQIQMNQLNLDFEFRFDDTYYDTCNINDIDNDDNKLSAIEKTFKSFENVASLQNIDKIELINDKEWINYVRYKDDKKNQKCNYNQLQFKITFKLNLLRIRDEMEKYYDTKEFFMFHFEEYAKVLKRARCMNQMNRSQIFEINYSCKEILTNYVKQTKYIIDILENDYNYGQFAYAFYNLLWQYLCINDEDNISNIIITDNENESNDISKSLLNKLMQCRCDEADNDTYNHNKVPGIDEWAQRELTKLVKKRYKNYYFDTCCTSTIKPNILYNNWYEIKNDENLHFYLSLNKWFINRQLFINIISLNKIVYNKCKNACHGDLCLLRKYAEN